jgi:hydrogenase expression/formation protein HypE
MADAPDWSCPVPVSGDVITLAHGGGGRALRRLLADRIGPAVGKQALAHDAAVLAGPDRLAFTTDSYVVSPLAFPGGDIGRLAVCGTVNDLAMAGAEPLALSLALILEEGLPLATLDRVLASVAAAAAEVGVRVVTGDTKVVPRGLGDGVYIYTAGIGRAPAAVIGPSSVRAGDVVLVSGDLGRHGIAILGARGELGLDVPIESDCAPLVAPVRALLDAGVDVRCLRDCTRGGAAAALTEVAGDAGVDLRIGDAPVHPAVRAACELLGFDPLHIACEGRFVAWVAAGDAERALAVLRGFDPAATRLGQALDGRGRVLLADPWGGERVLDLPLGDPLPRIC